MSSACVIVRDFGTTCFKAVPVFSTFLLFTTVAEGYGKQCHGVTFLSQRLVVKRIGADICMALNFRCLSADVC